MTTWQKTARDEWRAETEDGRKLRVKSLPIQGSPRFLAHSGPSYLGTMPTLEEAQALALSGKHKPQAPTAPAEEKKP